MFRQVLAGISVVASVFGASTAFAQSPAGPAQDARPYRGVFGSGVNGTDQLLTFNLSLLGGNTTSVETTKSTNQSSENPLPSAVQSVQSSFEQVTAGVNYSLTHKRATITASAVEYGTYYQSLNKTIVSSAVTVAGSFTLSPRTTLAATETFSYQPLFFSSTFPTVGSIGVGQPVIPDTTTGVRLDHFENQSSVVTVSEKLSQKLDVSLGYSRLDSTFASDDETITQAVNGRINVGVTRHLAFFLDESVFIIEGQSAGNRTTSRGQLLNFGLSYDRLASISLSRHLKLSLGAGLSALSNGGREQLAVTGNSTLTYQMARSWTAAAGYNRGVGFVAFFEQPVTTDGAIAQLSGSLTRRVALQVSAGASRSTVGFNGPSNGYSTEYAAASLTFGLSRSLGVGIGYADYAYRFDAGLQLPSGILSRSNSQTVYAYLNLWQPLFATRRGNASR